ncbi:MAG: hypothetical protein WC830_23155 [Burkholderiales bacterium]
MGVDQHHFGVVVDDYHCVGRRLQQILEFLLGLLALGDVAKIPDASVMLVVGSNDRCGIAVDYPSVFQRHFLVTFVGVMLVQILDPCDKSFCILDLASH